MQSLIVCPSSGLTWLESTGKQLLLLLLMLLLLRLLLLLQQLLPLLLLLLQLLLMLQQQQQQQQQLTPQAQCMAAVCRSTPWKGSALLPHFFFIKSKARK